VAGATSVLIVGEEGWGGRLNPPSYFQDPQKLADYVLGRAVNSQKSQQRDKLAHCQVNEAGGDRFRLFHCSFMCKLCQHTCVWLPNSRDGSRRGQNQSLIHHARLGS